MKRFLLLVLFFGLLISGSMATLAQEDQKDEFIIMYDESHNQYFNTSMMQTALESLNDTFDQTIKLIVQKDEFNQTNLQGADLLMVTNPGLNDDGEPLEVDQSEVDAVKTYIDLGGSVFFLSNPISLDPDLAGHGEPMNDFFQAASGVQMGVQIKDSSSGAGTDFDNTSVIIDDFNFYQNQSYVYVYPENFNEEVFTKELNNVAKANGRFLYYGAHIEATGQQSTIWANTSKYAYVVDKEYTISKYQDGPEWMYARDFGEDKGRAMLVGSTIMFSDLGLNETHSWINAESNLELFQNLVAWLLKITPIPEDLSIVTQNFAFFLRSNLLYAFLVGAVFFTGVFGIYIYQGKVRPSQIFQISDPSSSKTTKKSKSTKKGKSDKKSSDKKKKRRRRKRT